MIITYPLNEIEYSASDVETYLCTRTSGLFSDEMAYVARQGDSLKVIVSPFIAWINNGDFKGKSVVSNATETLELSPAESVLDRIDRIVLRFDASLNKSYLAVLKGVPSSTPVGTALTRTEYVYELCIAEILIEAGRTAINPENIHSTILDESLCGLMRDGVTRIPTQQLYNEFSGVLESMRNTIANVKGDEILDEIYPIGSIYVTQTNESPSLSIGGSWELVNKDFSSLAVSEVEMASGVYLVPQSENATTFNRSIVRNGHQITLQGYLVCNKEILDAKVVFGKYNLTKLGVSAFFSNRNVISGYSDSGKAIVLLEIDSTGEIFSTDVVGSTGLNSGESFLYQTTLTVPFENMLDSACDRFYWKRVEGQEAQ